MRTILRLAATAITAAVVLASPTVAVADEHPEEEATVTAAGGAVDAAEPVCDETSPADPTEDADPAVQPDQDETSDATAADDPCARPAEDPGDEATGTPTPDAAGEGTAEATTEPGDEAAGESGETSETADDPATDPGDTATADPSTDPSAEPAPDPSGEAPPEPGEDPVGGTPTDADAEPWTGPDDGTDDASVDPTQDPATTPDGTTAEETATGGGESPAEAGSDPTPPDPAGADDTPETGPEGVPATTPPKASPKTPETTRATEPATTPHTTAPALPTTATRQTRPPLATGAARAAATTTTPLAVLTSVPAGPSPLTVPFAAVDAFPAYQPQVFCDPTPKPGTAYLARLAISYFGEGHLAGISRDCSLGPTSEHKEGRAFDWALRVDVPEEKAAGDAFAQWLTAIGPDGQVGYNARRLGVMYLIWNEQIWMNTDADASWHPYYGPSPHTDHVHVSLTWAGAYQHTSWWTGDPVPDRAELARLAGQAWARVFGHEPDPAVLQAWLTRLAEGGALPVSRVELWRLAAVFATVLDAGRWGLERPAVVVPDEPWVTTVSMPVL